MNALAASVRQVCAKLRPDLAQLLRERADELRFNVDLARAQALHDGYPPDQVALIGSLELGWADFLDALGGRRP
jgi:hypothetical protein